MPALVPMAMMPRAVAADLARAVIGHHDPAEAALVVIARPVIVRLVTVAIVPRAEVMPAMAVVSGRYEVTPGKYRPAMTKSAAVERRTVPETAATEDGGCCSKASSATTSMKGGAAPEAATMKCRASAAESAATTASAEPTTTAVSVSATTVLYLRECIGRLFRRGRSTRPDQRHRARGRRGRYHHGRCGDHAERPNETSPETLTFRHVKLPPLRVPGSADAQEARRAGAAHVALNEKLAIAI
ncbi:hypothetical protein [Tardiphaga sp.]|uniref:hypothetical protein n=1 Tax=Tardiphaga sp. TaxID=1926292 RepID=UPI003450618F